MNKLRRKQIQVVIDALVDLKEKVELDIKEEEENYMDEMPENLQNSERYEKAENAVGCLDYAIDNIQDAIENLEEAQE